MINSDFRNELHVRMFIVEILKDKIGDSNFEEMADKALRFILKGKSLPALPEKDNTMLDMMRVAMPNLFNVKTTPIEEPGDKLYDFFYKYRYREVADPRNQGRVGVIAGYSDEMDSLLVSCYGDSERGMDKGERDVVELPDTFSKNGFFYITVDEAEKQLK